MSSLFNLSPFESAPLTTNVPTTNISAGIKIYDEMDMNVEEL